jgi:hypothetical protein
MPTMTERHEHKGPQCHHSHEEVCKEPSCAHDPKIAKDVEVSCKPMHGQADRYECVHTHS